LHLVESVLNAATPEKQDLYSGIVQLQAVYGKDTSAPPDGVVDTWDAIAPVDAAGWQQIRAIRVALVARSQKREPEVVTLDGNNPATTCDSPTPPPAAVCWRPEPGGNGVTIDVNIGNAIPAWQHYRYHVVETTIPVRNSIWQQ
jgi:type IV pilus assembly protein PilW